MGVKWQLADLFTAHVPLHESYVEPFAGSAAVFFRKYKSPVEVLNDLDGELVNFFEVVRNRTDEFIHQIEWTPYAQSEYDRSFDTDCDEMERARRFYISAWMAFGATRVNKSGWRRQTKNGMQTPVTETWKRLDGIKYAGSRLRDAQIPCEPAVDCIQRWDSPKTLFYVDPPYVMKSRSNGSRKRYVHEMDDAEHVELAEVLNKVKGMVLLSGYNSELYAELYKGWKPLEKTTTTTGNGTAKEVLWLSPSIMSVKALPLFSSL